MDCLTINPPFSTSPSPLLPTPASDSPRYTFQSLCHDRPVQEQIPCSRTGIRSNSKSKGSTMNVHEPFSVSEQEQAHWHLPSPSSTPQTNKYHDFFVQTSHIPPPTSTPQLGNVTSPAPAFGGIGYVSGHTVPTSSQDGGLYEGLAAPHTTLTSNDKQMYSGYAGGVTSSFLQQLDDASLNDSSGLAAWQNIPDMDFNPNASSQMQTPPPTRQSSKRKQPQQQPIAPFQTPSTIHSRRMSAPGDSWLKRASDSAQFDATPLQFNAFGFPTPTDATPFQVSGPATAPAYPQAGLFWDPSSAIDQFTSSFAPIAEDPLQSTTDIQADALDPAMHVAFSSPGPAANLVTPRAKRDSLLQRPRTAQPARQRPATIALTNCVDPSMIWSTQSQSVNTINISDAAPTEISAAGKQPYQYHFEELKREKEARSRRASLIKDRVEVSGAAALAGQTLRRSLSDVRSRKPIVARNGSSGSSTELKLITRGLNDAQIPREGSPLKRHRGHDDVHESPAKSGLRSSVVLEVDDQGNARTVLKPVERSPQDTDSPSVPLDSEPSSSEDEIDLPNISRNMVREPEASSDAKDALRAIVMTDRTRQRNKLADNRAAMAQRAKITVTRGASQMQTRIESSVVSDTNPGMTVLPSNNGGAMQSSQSQSQTRCVCNNVVSNRGQFMIQCESCGHTLHASCLGFTQPQQIPMHFVCTFCSPAWI